MRTTGGNRTRNGGQATFLGAAGGVLVFGVWMKGRAKLRPLLANLLSRMVVAD